MEDLLREEEDRNKEGLRAEKGQIPVMDVFHVGSGEHAVLLGGEVDDEAEGGYPLCRAVGDAHIGCSYRERPTFEMIYLNYTILEPYYKSP